MMGNLYWSPGLTLKAVEGIFAEEALKFYEGNEKSAASALGITLEKFHEIIGRNKLEAEAQKKRDEEITKNKEEFLRRSRGVVEPDPNTGFDTMRAYTPADGIAQDQAAATLAATAPVPGRVTPENALPTAAVVPNAGDPVAAAKRTQMLVQEHLPEGGEAPTFPPE